MTNPKVSVLIPCYNVELYVEEAVRSIMNQTYSNLEILVIDDGSTDKTAEILQKLAQIDSRIKYIKNETNLRLIATLNKGIELCTGKYIARMDADDISLPTRIEKQVQFLEKNPQIGIVGSYLKEFGLSNKTWRTEIKDKEIKSYLFFNTCFAHPSVIIRQDLLKTTNIRYNENYPHAEDYKFWCDLSEHTQFANLPETFLLYRINDNQVSKKYIDIQEQVAGNIRQEHINNYLKKQDISLRYEKNNNVSDLKILRKEIKDRIFLKSLLLVWYFSLRTNKITILKNLFLDFPMLGLKNTMRVLYYKVFLSR